MSLTLISRRTKSEKYLVENFAARDVNLSTSELAEIRQVIEAHRPVGDRYAPGGMAGLDGST